MPAEGAPLDPIANDTLNGEIDLCPHERLCRLQYMIAFLLEKNEQIRQELAAKRYAEPS
jgi:hypothetical protein